MRFSVLAFIGLAAPAFADCPAVPDQSARLADLTAQVRAAPNEAAARQISGRMWEIWTTAPDAKAQDLLDRGMRALAAADFATAYDRLSALIAYCPDYAEGYNQRAFASYLRQDFAAALVDLEAAIARQPGHVGALSGRALTLMGLGRADEGQTALREALKVNPWLSERHLLIEPVGEEL